MYKNFLIFLFLVSSIIFAQNKNIKVISPNGNERLQIGTRQTIVWTSKNIERIDIFYSINHTNSWKKIAENIKAEIGAFSWKIPNFIGEEAFIKVISHSDKDIFDVSDTSFYFSNNFSIKGSLYKKNDLNSQTVIMPLGNSITFDNRVDDIRDIGDKAGYRKHLYELLSNAGIDFSFTGSEHSGGNFLPAGYDGNAGFPGITDDQLLMLLKTGRRVQPYHGIDEQITPGKYFETYPADIVLLHIGTNGNDASSGTSPDDIEGILDNIDSINTETTVILARIIDRVPNKSYVTQFNDNVEAMALDRVNNPSNDAYPDKIVIVDMQNGAGIDYTIDSMGTVGDGIPGDMNDMYHPNDKGYYKMAEVWFNAIASVIITPPVVTLQPEDYSTVVGKPAQFRVSASGTKPLNYQWRRNGQNISGATDSVYQISSVQALDNNTHISCRVSNPAGNAVSNEATLYVAGENERVKSNLQVLYDFEGNGNTVEDVSNVGTQIDLTIANIDNTNKVPYGVEVTESTIISADNSPQKIFDSVTNSNEITVEAWVRPNNTTQTGPARIVTFSKDGSQRNFTLGQLQNEYIFRLNTSNTDANGEPALSTVNGSATTDLTHVVYTRDTNGEADFYINGIGNNSVNNLTGNFSTWDNTFSFGLANEFTTDRSWLGRYYLVAVYNRALSKDEVEHNFTVGFNGINKLLFPPTNLTGTVENDTVVNLSWNDNSTEEIGYVIERKANSIDSVYYVLDTLNANTVTYSDYKTKHSTSYLYRVKAYNNQTESDYSDSLQVDGIVSDINTENVVKDFKLYQNYPNPFNPSTTIKYAVPEQSKVSLIIYDALGREVTTLLNNVKTPKGIYSIEFNTSKLNKYLTSGIYFYRFVATPSNKSETFIQTKKIIFIK